MGSGGKSDLCHFVVEAREDKRRSNKGIKVLCQVKLFFVPMLNYKRKLGTSACITACINVEFNWFGVN